MSATALAPLVLSKTTPALFLDSAHDSKRFWEFFTAHIRNAHTRRAYFNAAASFSAWCEARGMSGLSAVQPIHVAAYVEELGRQKSAPSVKVHLAGIRMLFDWLVVGQVVAMNPASVVRGPKHSAKKGKTPVLTAEEARLLLDSMDSSTAAGLRDRAMIALMIYTFARVGAVLGMRIEDVFVQGRRTWVRLHEKGGKRHEMPCHHRLDAYLHDYLEARRIHPGAAQTRLEPKAWLFPSLEGRSGQLSGRAMSQPDVHRMIRRRAKAAGIETSIGCHSFRATGITEYLRNGGKLEMAQQMANHESARTTGLYDRRNDQVSLDEVERILI
jgi:site-specific recombinase XerD